MLDVIILCIIFILFFLVIYKKELFKVRQNNIVDYMNFIHEKKGKKKNVFIFSSGPSLNEIEEIKKKFSKEFWDDCYTISVKSAINVMSKHDIKTDFLVSNFSGTISKLDYNLLEKEKPIVFGGNYYDKKKDHKLKKYVDYFIEIGRIGNMMQCIEKDDENCIDFQFFEDNVNSGWGHVMMELAIPLAISLKPKNIYTLGWDVKNSKKYFDSKENFKNYSDENVILEFTKFLPDYLKKHYDINIYKTSKNQEIKLPLI